MIQVFWDQNSKNVTDMALIMKIVHLEVIWKPTSLQLKL